MFLLSIGIGMGCDRFSGGTPSPTPSASPTPTVTEALASASDDLSQALSELRSRNVKGSLELVDRSIASLKAAAGGASAASRAAINDALTKAESVRGMIANGDKKAEETLAKMEKTMSDLVDSASKVIEDAKRSAQTAIGQAADRVKEAVGTPTPTPTPRRR